MTTLLSPVTSSAEDQASALLTTRQRREGLSGFMRGLMLLDTAVLIVAALLAIGIKFGYSSWPPDGIEWLTGLPIIDFGWVVPIWLIALALNGAWSARTLGRGPEEFKALIRGSLVGAGIVAVAAYLINYDMSRGYFALSWGIGTAGLLAERWGARHIVARRRRRQQLINRVVVVGDGAAVAEVDAALSRQPGLGYRVVGACVGSTDAILPVPVLGAPSAAVQACITHQADVLLVTHGAHASSVDLRQIGWDLEGTGIELIVVPNLIDVAAPRIEMRPVAGLPFVHVEAPRAARAMRWGKAVFDRLCSLALLAAFAPLLLITAAAIAVGSRGPVFYRQRRVGVDGREFGVWKFRTMVPGADRQHEQLITSLGADTLLFKLVDDPRVTRIGRLLRRYSIDELPQLANVLVGQMSLVGPRPQVAAEVACYDDQTRHRRLRVRPGMTGLWQVSGRSDLSSEEAARLDLYYVENWSMVGDLSILARTIRAVLRHDGAY